MSVHKHTLIIEADDIYNHLSLEEKEQGTHIHIMESSWDSGRVIIDFLITDEKIIDHHYASRMKKTLG